MDELKRRSCGYYEDHKQDTLQNMRANKSNKKKCHAGLRPFNRQTHIGRGEDVADH